MSSPMSASFLIHGGVDGSAVSACCATVYTACNSARDDGAQEKSPLILARAGLHCAAAEMGERSSVGEGTGCLFLPTLL